MNQPRGDESDNFPIVSIVGVPIRDMIESPIHPAGDCCIHHGIPCILYGEWDHGEDWSGEYVQIVHPFALVDAPKITTEQFWAMVKALHP